MRKREKEVQSPEAIALVLREAPWGALSLATPGGKPFLVPLAFVYVQERLFFHSAPAGEKLTLIKTCPEAAFLVVDTFAKIPSYLFHPSDGGAGLTLFRSIILHGRLSLVGDLELKAVVLQAMLNKYQPEGSHEPVTATSPTYQAREKGLAIVEMTIEQKSGKFGLGQALNDDDMNLVTDFLAKRGTDNDQHTLATLAFGMGPGNTPANLKLE